MPAQDANADQAPTHGPALHAPWRLQYLEALGEEDAASENKPERAGESSGSFLLDYWRTPEHDHANNVIHRDDHGMILLNGYPYANGHLLVALGEARPTLLDYKPAQRRALWQLVDLATDLAQHALEPQGLNIGINQGRAAGAGVPQHLHVHLVPRWGGDTNFITSVARIRIIPAALEAMADRYRSVLRAVLESHVSSHEPRPH
ncbi:MAG: HIT domain-containing protein [Planctomycetota bacterium]